MEIVRNGYFIHLNGFGVSYRVQDAREERSKPILTYDSTHM